MDVDENAFAQLIYYLLWLFSRDRKGNLVGNASCVLKMKPADCGRGVAGGLKKNPTQAHQHECVSPKAHDAHKSSSYRNTVDGCCLNFHHCGKLVRQTAQYNLKSMFSPLKYKECSLIVCVCVCMCAGVSLAFAPAAEVGSRRRRRRRRRERR